MVGVPPYGTPTVTAPIVPNPSASTPVAASTAISLLPLMNRMRAGNVPSPGQ